MTFKIFLEFIRLNAKAASGAVFYCILFSIYYFHAFNWINSLIYLVAQVAIALFVTGFNNVQDYYLAKDLHYRDTYNIVGREHLSPRRSLNLMLAMLATAIILGLVLVVRTNLLLLSRVRCSDCVPYLSIRLARCRFRASRWVNYCQDVSKDLAFSF